MTIDDGRKLWFSGGRGRGESAKCVIECKPVSIHLITMRLAGQPFNLTIVQMYAPTCDSSEQAIESIFFQDLGSVVTTIPNTGVIVVLGDWYAKVGADAYSTWQDTTGKCGPGSTNDRGLLLVEFDKFNYLDLPNTFHPYKHSRKSS